MMRDLFRTLLIASAILVSMFTHAADIVLDGSFDDWQRGTPLQADAQHLYVLMEFVEVQGLQSSTIATSIYIDADGDTSTGAQILADNGEVIFAGAELELMFAPVSRRNDTGLSGGAALKLYDDNGQAEELPHQFSGFASMPTHASALYEIRVPRVLHSDDLTPRQRGLVQAINGRLQQLGQARMWYAQWDAAGELLALSDTAAAVEKPPFAIDSTVLSDMIPVIPEQAVRIVSVNVEWAAPVDNPDRFVRVARALNADIYLLQEWDKPAFVLPEGSEDIRYSPSQMVQWFSEHVDSQRTWYASRNDELGVIIVSAWPLQTLSDPAPVYQLLDAGQMLQQGRVRYTAAIAETPLGKLLLSNIHLRCCGAPGTREDHNRMAESLAVNTAFRSALQIEGVVGGVIAGDYNLVGSPLPLASIARAADKNNRDLAVVPALNLVQTSALTWRDARSVFPPSRLDYLLYTDSALILANAFVFDTEDLTDNALQHYNLLRDDSLFSDHLPIVVDLVLP